MHLCEELETGVRRAVKSVEDRKCHNRTYCPIVKESIPNEIALWRSLSHPNIVTLLDVYLDCRAVKKWYLVMEYDPQFMDLFDYVDQNGVMSSQDGACLIRQLIEVVQYLTQQNVDHRDLKDENILYNPSNHQIKLIDFGSAGPLSSDPYTKHHGTDVYIPPEHYITGQHLPLDAAVWAIGCISYIILDGDCPFRTKQDVIEYTSIDKLKPQLSKRTLRLDFIRSCLTPCPVERTKLCKLTMHQWLRQ